MTLMGDSFFLCSVVRLVSLYGVLVTPLNLVKMMFECRARGVISMLLSLQQRKRSEKLVRLNTAKPWRQDPDSHIDNLRHFCRVYGKAGDLLRMCNVDCIGERE